MVGFPELDISPFDWLKRSIAQLSERQAASFVGQLDALVIEPDDSHLGRMLSDSPLLVDVLATQDPVDPRYYLLILPGNREEPAQTPPAYLSRLNPSGVCGTSGLPLDVVGADIFRYRFLHDAPLVSHLAYLGPLLAQSERYASLQLRTITLPEKRGITEAFRGLHTPLLV
ncbi:MAG: hypothetical protein Q7S65_04945 [Nanoarchaeota archaeon]|nr:hypothetical protein [Nanoarchaeota archaeon]